MAKSTNTDTHTDLPKPETRRTPIRRICVLLCTRDRPEQLDVCLKSLASQQVPDGITWNVCVVDNNMPRQEQQIKALATAHGLDITYAHESQPGYSSVRNTGLLAAIKLDVDLLILLDDDSTASPDIIARYLEAFERYDADVIAGAITGVHFRVKEGERLKKSGTGNVALRRWIFDKAHGLGLRFDPRLNLLGYEDFEFFRELTSAGGTMIRSGLPVAHDLPLSTATGNKPLPNDLSERERIIFFKMSGRNEIVVTRIRHGRLKALSCLATRYMPIFFRGVGLRIGSIIALPFNRQIANEKRMAGRYQLARVSSAIAGLWAPGYSRPRAKQGQLEILPETTV